MICENVIKSYLDTLREGFHCRQSPNGRLSIVTPYLYPDHDNIEVFVRPKDGIVTVSDLGETLRSLDTLGLDVMDTPNALFAAQRIAEGFGVAIDRGILVKRGSADSVGSLVLDVILACQSVGSLIYGSRA